MEKTIRDFNNVRTEFSPAKSEPGKNCLQSLMRIWFEFDRDINAAPMIQKLIYHRLDKHDSLALASTLRDQMHQGAKWVSTCASNFDHSHADVRSDVMAHAFDRHHDHDLAKKASSQENVGAQALDGYMMYRASQPNPVDLIGALWIAEGLRKKMTSQWALFKNCHTSNKVDYLDKLYSLVNRVCQTDDQVQLMTRTARVFSHLFLIRLEKIDHGVLSS